MKKKLNKSPIIAMAIAGLCVIGLIGCTLNEDIPASADVLSSSDISSLESREPTPSNQLWENEEESSVAASSASSAPSSEPSSTPGSSENPSGKEQPATASSEPSNSTASRTPSSGPTPSAAPSAPEPATPPPSSERQTSAPQNKNQSYVLNTNTKKFHRTTCKEVKRIKAKNYATASTREEAVNGGYVPCKKCNP